MQSLSKNSEPTQFNNSKLLNNSELLISALTHFSTTGTGWS
jgi:hypothetical protein